jgi:hypothetical protein
MVRWQVGLSLGLDVECPGLADASYITPLFAQPMFEQVDPLKEGLFLPSR